MKRGVIMAKKGQGLPMNTVIITILVILVLFVVAAFFLGGTSGVTKLIRGVFFESISGTDSVFASQTCQQRCDQLKLLPQTDIARKGSAYCKDFFHLDEDNDGEADFTGTGDDKKYKQFYCYKNSKSDYTLSVSCPLVIKGETQSPEIYCN